MDLAIRIVGRPIKMETRGRTETDAIQDITWKMENACRTSERKCNNHHLMDGGCKISTASIPHKICIIVGGCIIISGSFANFASLDALKLTEPCPTSLPGDRRSTLDQTPTRLDSRLASMSERTRYLWAKKFFISRQASEILIRREWKTKQHLIMEIHNLCR